MLSQGRSREEVPNIAYTDSRGQDPFLIFALFWVSHLLQNIWLIIDIAS